MKGPTSNYVWIDPSGEKKEVIGSILVPVTVEQRPQKGIAIAIGPEVKNIEIGETCLFKAFTNYQKYDNEGKEILIMRETEIVSVL